MLPSMVTVAPWWFSRSASVVMSASRGRFDSLSGWSVNRAAHISGRAAFFDPLICNSPESGRPPRITILSIEPLRCSWVLVQVCGHSTVVRVWGGDVAALWPSFDRLRTNHCAIGHCAIGTINTNGSS